ncbi:MAG TPA: phosphotransferase [Candidatus Limnocylindria bacterium]|nr:phosphotransferase [Candidatus Limnocylindria bacterium]
MHDAPRPGPLIATGRTADVHAWADGTVLKLLRRGFPDSLGEEEAMAAARVTAAGLAAPRFLGTERVDGRFGLVYERVDGPSMVQVLVQQPDRADELAAMLADLHAAMHDQPGTGLPDLRDGLADAIDRAPDVAADARAAARSRLEALPAGDALVHGDFHPGNVVMADGGPVVIDWLTAGAGAPAADVARTRFLLTDTVLDEQIPRERHALVETLRHRFADAYLRRYRSLRQLDESDVAAWRLPILVARAAERVAGEASVLRELISAAR